MSTTIYCASNGYSGVWAFSRDAIVAFAPKEMLEGNEYSTGEVWEATLGDLDGALWAFSPVVWQSVNLHTGGLRSPLRPATIRGQSTERGRRGDTNQVTHPAMQ